MSTDDEPTYTIPLAVLRAKVYGSEEGHVSVHPTERDAVQFYCSNGSDLKLGDYTIEAQHVEKVSVPSTPDHKLGKGYKWSLVVPELPELGIDFDTVAPLVAGCGGRMPCRVVGDGYNYSWADYDRNGEVVLKKSKKTSVLLSVLVCRAHTPHLAIMSGYGDPVAKVEISQVEWRHSKVRYRHSVKSESGWLLTPVDPLRYRSPLDDSRVRMLTSDAPSTITKLQPMVGKDELNKGLNAMLDSIEKAHNHLLSQVHPVGKVIPSTKAADLIPYLVRSGVQPQLDDALGKISIVERTIEVGSQIATMFD